MTGIHSVKPRRRTPRVLPVVAIHGNDTLNSDGEVGTVDELIKRLPEMTPTLFTALSAADWVATLDSHFAPDYSASWQWRVSTHERELIRPDGIKLATRVSTIVHYFGWKGGNYHKIIDPVVMYGHRLDTIWPGDDVLLVKLLQWAVTLQEFCSSNGLEVRPTTGSIASQLLTDSHFYPKARRKVPAATNQRVRDVMPGNYYRLETNGRECRGDYLDQRRAHHYHARTTAFPHSDLLYAYGRFVDLGECVFDPAPWDSFYGLYCLDLIPPEQWHPFHWVGRYGRLDCQMVYSNELPHLLDMGYRVKGVRAAWGSRQIDTGLPAIGTWAETQLDKYNDPKWLKPLLLSVYGVLATRPRCSEAVFRLARKGEPVTLVTGHNKLSGLYTRGAKKLEPGIANVLHRGMIEAATRSESVGLAQWLDHLGYTTLSIYADAVIVEVDDDKPLPTLPEPWRCKKTLNHLQFINQQAFISDGMTKLPGVNGREHMRYRQQTMPGHAPRVTQYEALTDKRVLTDRRI